MKKRIKLKRKRNKINKPFLILIIILIGIFLALKTISYINYKAMPLLLNYSTKEITKLATLVINKALTKEISKNIDKKDLFTTIKDNEGKVQSVEFNSNIVNKVLSSTTNLVYLNLKAIEKGEIELLDFSDELLIEYDKNKMKKGIIFEVPMGVVFKNALLNNIGPKIPVRLNLIGNVISNIKTNIKSYGINTSIIEVYVHIEVSEKIILPFISKTVVVKTDIPVGIKMIQGEVPKYYQNGFTNNSSLYRLPIE